MIEREGPIHISNVMLLDPKGNADARGHRARGRRARAHRQEHRREDRLRWPATTDTAPPARLKARYLEEIRPALIERFGYSSLMQAPSIEKITLNMGVGLAKPGQQNAQAATEQLATIAGQQPSVRRARKSIAAFKLREGMPVGVAVTLRGERGYEFLDRLISIAIPRIRDFRGLNPRSFDGRGNYSMGVREQIIFPEIDYDAIDQVRGMDITITTTAAQRRRGLRAAGALGHAVLRAGPAQRLRRPAGPQPSADGRRARAGGRRRRRQDAAAAATEPEAAGAPPRRGAAEEPEADAEAAARRRRRGGAPSASR